MRVASFAFVFALFASAYALDWQYVQFKITKSTPDRATFCRKWEKTCTAEAKKLSLKASQNACSHGVRSLRLR